MNKRIGEKLGWTLGWLGAISWMPVLSVIQLLNGQLIGGINGLVLTLSGLFLIFYYTPWRFKFRPYWKLFLPLIIILALGVVNIIVNGFTKEEDGLNVWMFFWFIPLTLPIFQFGRKKWQDGEENQK